MTTYAVVVFDDAEELDFVGPWEVFTASEMVLNGGTLPELHVFTVSEHGGFVRANKGLRVGVDRTFATASPTDVVLVPGGRGTRRERSNPAMLQWLRERALTTPWMTSVCTGSLLLVESGVAEGRKVATHWGFEDELAALGTATVVRDQRFVHDGNVVSSQGVSAGIDMALWLIGQFHGPDHARAVQRYIQYHPEPPYAD